MANDPMAGQRSVVKTGSWLAALGAALYGSMATDPEFWPRGRVLFIWASMRIAMLGAVLYGIGASASGIGDSSIVAVIVVMTALGAAAWLGWMTAMSLPGHQGVLLTSVVTLAISGSVLAGVDPASPALVLSGAGMLVAAMTLSPASASGLCLASVIMLGGVGLATGHKAGSFGVYAAALFAITLGGVTRGQYLAQLRQSGLLVAQTKQTEVEQARTAALRERTRIAREIHDVLAHSLGALTVQLDAADAVLTAGQDASRAQRHVARARRLAVDGLAEARQAIRALRSGVDPLPEQLSRLCDEYQVGTGGKATLIVTGPPRQLSADAELTVFRTAQEALSNARKHGSLTAVDVRLAYGQRDLVLTIIDRKDPELEPETDPDPDPEADSSLAATGGGYGLAGLSERAALVDGVLSAGPDQAGWIVRLRLQS
jgi:signal transduction histidine kinase